jgi:hypothetical protein
MFSLPRKRSPDDNQLARQAGVADGELQRDGATHAEAEDVGMVEAEVTDKGRHIIGHVLVGDGAVDVGGAPVPLHLCGDHPAGLRQAGQDRPHCIDGHVGAVEQEKRPAGPVDLVEHPQAVDLGVAARAIVAHYPSSPFRPVGEGDDPVPHRLRRGASHDDRENHRPVLVARKHTKRSPGS